MVPPHANVPSTSDSISFTDLGARSTLLVEVRTMVIKLSDMGLESKLQKFHLIIVSFALSQGVYIPVLVGCDRTSRSSIAHAVPYKGADVSWTAEQVCRDLNCLGHCGRVTSRSDQEPALVVFFKKRPHMEAPQALFWSTRRLANRRRTVELSELCVLLKSFSECTKIITGEQNWREDLCTTQCFPLAD